MKSLRTLLLSSTFASIILAAPTQEVDIQALQEQINALQAQINELKNAQNDKISKVELDKELDTFHERVDENELQNALNKVKFGLDFSNAVTSLRATNDTDGTGGKRHNNGKFATELHLNMNAHINDRTKFTGRLSMAKYWGNLGTYGGVYDFDGGRDPNGNSVLYVSRAYLDYDIIPGVLTATVGRQPATDGPGANLRNNSVRMSTYPALLVNAMSDAIVFTYKPEALRDYKFASRLGYVRFYQGSEFGRSDGRSLLGVSDKQDGTVYMAMAEAQLPLGDMGKNLFMLSYGHVENYSSPLRAEMLGHTVLNSVYNIGDFDVANLHFENYETFDTPLSWFISASWHKGKNGTDNTKKAVAEAIDSSGGQTLQQLKLISAMAGDMATYKAYEAYGNMMEAQLTQTFNKALKWNEKHSWAVHLGARYDFTKEFKLGAEFFHGSKYWYSMSRTGISDPLDFRNTRGNVYDIYGIWQLDFNQYLRLSFTHIDYDYTNNGRGIGGTEKTNDRADIISLMYDVRF